jgi:hypothetical protein
MSRIQKRALFFVILAVILFIVVIFWPFFYQKVLFPAATACWILLRIFVLSIGQKYYWGALIIGLILMVLVKFSHLLSNTTEQEKTATPNSTLRDLEYWTYVFNPPDFSDREINLIKRELIHLLVMVYASNQKIVADYHVLDEFKNGKIEIPLEIQDFLFPDEKTQKKHSHLQRLKMIWKAPRQWVYRKSGHQRKDFFIMVNKVMSFLESSLEMNHEK